MRIDGQINTGAQAGGKANMQALLDRLNIGDVIKAKVLEVTSGELLLKLFDGTSVKARVEADIGVQPGDLIDFSVSSKKDGTVFLETVKKNDVVSDKTRGELKIQLENLNLKSEGLNLELAGKFRSAGVKLTADLLNKALDIAENFKNVTPDKAAYLASKNIVPDTGKADALFKMLEGRLNIGSQLVDLQKVLSELDSRKESKQATNSKNMFIQDISDSVSENGLEIKNTGVQPNTPEKSDVIVSKQQGGISGQSGTAVNLPISADVQQVAADTKQGVMPGQLKTAGAEDDLLKKTAVLQTGTSDNGTEVEKLQVPGALDGPKGPTATAKANGLASSFDKQGLSDRITIESELRASAGNDLSSVHSESSINTDVKTDKKAIADRLSDVFKGIFVKTDSQDLKSDLEAKKLYKEILTGLDDLKTAVKASGTPDSNAVISRIDNIHDGIQLLNQINNNSAYMQIPLNMSGFNTGGELYVMNRERKKGRLDPQDVVMLISLDTQNIGRIESIIDIKGRNVSMNMRSESQQINNFIRENFKELYDSLIEKGYRLVDIKYRLINEAVTPLNAEQTVRAALDEGKNTVDMRI